MSITSGYTTLYAPRQQITRGLSLHILHCSITQSPTRPLESYPDRPASASAFPGRWIHIRDRRSHWPPAFARHLLVVSATWHITPQAHINTHTLRHNPSQTRFDTHWYTFSIHTSERHHPLACASDFSSTFQSHRNNGRHSQVQGQTMAGVILKLASRGAGK